ncbi:hypothetical protein EYF80_031980 [Liparis tanakae]|uniref:Uncharacterized protein n=1 Tax=Liparis tanakae TaxID=230148 RepID=A0A4Z2GW97_9TELE|nr:hypothetical protein EYF80_031980 [Liparis tanakae]
MPQQQCASGTWRRRSLRRQDGQSRYLQLFDGVSSSTNHQPHLAGRDEHLLHGGSAFTIAVKTRTVSATVHDLDQIVQRGLDAS